MKKKIIFVEAKLLLPVDKKSEAIKKIVGILKYDGDVYLLTSNDVEGNQVEELSKIFTDNRIANFKLYFEEYKDVRGLIKDAVKSYENEYKRDNVRFLVVADEEINKIMWTHILDEPIYSVQFVEKANYALDNEFWCENPEINHRHVSDNKIEKVIFLDIDGVLNIENRCSEEFVIINEEFVKNLALITYMTNAEVVISSSWRYGLAGDFLNLEPDMGDSVTLMTSLFKKYNIPLAGITPLRFNGPDGRPFEIRQWLMDKADLKSFVILDDETFWKWNWLKKNVVCTSYVEVGEDGRIHTKCGLTKEHALEAIKILNGD